MRGMILAAGFGTRLRPLTDLIPKPLAPVANRPVMGHILALLERHGVGEVIANISYLPEAMRDAFRDGSEYGVSLEWSEEPAPLGTAGGVVKAAEFLTSGGDDCFCVISGDALTDVDLSALVEAHRKSGAVATLACKQVDDPSEFGVIVTDGSGDGDGLIEGFQEKPSPGDELSNLANCGIYVFDNSIFDHFPPADHESPAGPDDQPDGFVDWAMDVFPALFAGDAEMRAHEITDYWNDIGSLDELLASNQDALRGLVRVDLPGERASEGIRIVGEPNLAEARLDPPILIGEGVRFGSNCEVHGPTAIGDGVSIGEGVTIRESVVLPGSKVEAGSTISGEIFGLDR
ncbi:MAG: sugar phosphate nucleotidyltransferase [bacterium]